MTDTSETAPEAVADAPVAEHVAPITPPSPPIAQAAPAPDVFIKRPITAEEWREYVYQDGYVYKIVAPQTLYLKKNEIGASHRVVDMDGVTHYVAPGFRVIRWKTKPGFPEVAF